MSSAHSPIRIRRATVADADAIAEIYNHEVEFETSTFDLIPRTLAAQKEWIEARSGAFSAIVAVDENDAVVGFGALSEYRDRAAYKTSVENSVYVRRNLPRSGIGKLILTVFRLFAIIGIGYWLFDIIKKKATPTLITAVSLIFAGALGNILDSLFYGILFNDSYNQVATLFSEEPYGSLFYGKVVDMLYFPLIDTNWPEWVPWVGGDNFRFFEPVFNVADTAISTGVGILIVFNKKAFGKKES